MFLRFTRSLISRSNVLAFLSPMVNHAKLCCCFLPCLIRIPSSDLQIRMSCWYDLSLERMLWNLWRCHRHGISSAAPLFWYWFSNLLFKLSIATLSRFISVILQFIMSSRIKLKTDMFCLVFIPFLTICFYYIKFRLYS